MTRDPRHSMDTSRQHDNDMEPAAVDKMVGSDTASGSLEPPIILPVINAHQDPQVLIFNLNDLKQLRNQYGILGVLLGTLSQYPQQNFFLSIPLRLSVYEVVWLVETRRGILVDQLKYRKDKLLTSKQTGKDIKVHVRKDGVIEENAHEYNFITTRNTDKEGRNEELIHEHQIQLQEYIDQYIVSNKQLSRKQFMCNYQNFKYFKELNYYISPGLKFGGDLVLYPSDPLRFHSHSIVRLGSIDLNDIIIGGRLATGVKKNYIVVDTQINSNEDHDHESIITILQKPDTPKVFSVEWAGFG
ncbi:uncharacterized protein RJT21DRAFT_124033 [Scheffersomyces amazonensis]|uniref:uncharacterized protein n=1 Tax=Scheffersomyces amazonensis TaxID=1078765 RepID=UPI00315C6D8B